MGTSQLFHQDLIFLDLNFKNQDEYFASINKILLAKNLVKNSFIDFIKKRELEFPTALPISPTVAIPHTSIEHINKPFICFTRLTHEIDWYEMGNNDNNLKTKLIFLLGFNDTTGHLALLETLIDKFMNNEFVTTLLSCTNPVDCYNFLGSEFNK